MNNINYYKSIILILIIITVAGIIYYVARSEYYPVAIVNFRPILYKDYNTTLVAMNNFTKARSIPLILKNNLNSESFGDPSFVENMRRMVLAEMVKNEIMRQGINGLKIADLDNKIKNKIESVLSVKEGDSEFLAGVEILYGLELGRFKELILTPFARKEILIEEKMVDNLDEWFDKEKNKAGVYIFLNNMKWDKDKGEVASDY